VNLVKDAYRNFTAEAENELPELYKYKDRLTRVGNKIKDELNSLRIKRLVPGRCDLYPF
jgi:hypothetical protein